MMLDLFYLLVEWREVVGGVRFQLEACPFRSKLLWRLGQLTSLLTSQIILDTILLYFFFVVADSDCVMWNVMALVQLLVQLYAK